MFLCSNYLLQQCEKYDNFEKKLGEKKEYSTQYSSFEKTIIK
jgi:hypothetical protein